MLFEHIINGPIVSRRLGQSLGVNLMPVNGKLCSFDCVYCECGFNADNKNPNAHRPTKEEVITALNTRLNALRAEERMVDTITFAGNGEPTLHPHFAEIIDGVIAARNQYFPKAVISVLSNATACHNPKVFAALNKVNNNILKLDSAIDATAQVINQPCGHYSVAETIEHLKKFNGHLIVQTLFFSGDYNGHHMDNTTETEVAAWLKAMKYIAPREVMIYSLDRPTPAKNLRKADAVTLQRIAARAEAAGLKVQLTL